MAQKTIGGLVAAGSVALSNQIAIWNGSTTLRATFTQILALLTAAIDEISGSIPVAENTSYPLSQYAAYGYTINSLVIRSASGTCTARLTIDGVDVTGISAVAVSSTSGDTVVNATGTNTVAVGQTVELILSANAAALKVSFSIKATRS